MSRERKTLCVTRTRTDYARSHGDSRQIRIVDPLSADLELPASYAQALRAELERALKTDQDFKDAEIAVDVPVRLYLRPVQVEQLVRDLAEGK